MSGPPAVLYSADVMCPMASPPLADGGVLAEGDTIAAVGPAARLRAHADREHHLDGVLLPGLVNGHTQVEHADAHALARPTALPDWLRALEGITAGWDRDRWSRSARRGVHRMLRGGATATGDVVTAGPGVPASTRAGLAGDSWVDIAMVDGREQDEVLAALEHSLTRPAPGRRVGIAPRAAYSLDTGTLQALADLAERADAPLHTRAGQAPAEEAAIRHGTGPLAEAARSAGMAFSWLDGGTGLSPVRYLDLFGLLTPRATLAHGVFVKEDDAGLLADRGVAMVCCPRSDERLSEGEAPLERYADCGVRLALGTDSPAAAPDLDMLAEAAAWVSLACRRGLSAWPAPDGRITLEEQALRLATCAGADAMGWGHHSGRLVAGRRADLVGVAVATTPERAYDDVLASGAGRQVLTVLGGVRAARRPDPATPWPAVDHQERRG